jgi:hypothetical protein
MLSNEWHRGQCQHTYMFVHHTCHLKGRQSSETSKHPNILLWQLTQGASAKVTKFVERARQPDQCVLEGVERNQSKHLDNPVSSQDQTTERSA